MVRSADAQARALEGRSGVVGRLIIGRHDLLVDERLRIDRAQRLRKESAASRAGMITLPVASVDVGMR
jgi:hypothetical protein